MDRSQQSSQGFDPHVVDQLKQIAAAPASDNRGRTAKRRGKPQYQKFEYESHEPRLQQQNQFASQGAISSSPHPMNSGFFQQTGRNSSQSHVSSTHGQQYIHRSTYQHVQQERPERQLHGHQQLPLKPHSANEFPNRGRGNGRYGSRSRGGVSSGHANFRGASLVGGTDDFSRPSSNQSRLFQPGGNPFFGTADQQRNFRHKIMSQSDFLGFLADRTLQNQITAEEFRDKEAFRKTIEEIAQNVISMHDSAPRGWDIAQVKLKLYGSLGSGFGVAGSDMDLLLTFPQDGTLLAGIETESRRWLEKGLLDAGYGARLLTNTRVPILKVCQKPSSELLNNLREYRQQWEDSASTDSVTSASTVQDAPLPPFMLATTNIVDALQEVSLEAIGIPLPDTTQVEQTKLEFVGQCGIQCDINFTNYVALRNTELLKIYGLCDPRVRQVGLFVKNWAKARDINTPYKGTLSSYGYIMLVLHFLMNVVTPPVLPNLQSIAKDQDKIGEVTDLETVEGFDVRFVRDPEQLHHIMASMSPNHESLGSLLRGFFWYYACNGGFHWTRDVVSIRTRGGQLSKQMKGWTGAKWAESKQNVRLRYLLAIEDPFETEHNIGRTVGHSGIVAIRDEFRRAWSIIENVQLDQAQRAWFWSSKENEEPRNAEELMEIVQNRGDLLRKDQVAHKDRMRQMRKDAEAKEQVLSNTRSDTGNTGHGNDSITIAASSGRPKVT